MALSDIAVPTETISVGRHSFSVRGLSFEDVTALIQRHQAALESMIGMYGKASDADLLQFLIRESPTLAAQIIALASDEPDQELAVRKLPMPAQVDALTAVAKLTFEETGGVKKFAGQIAGLLGGMRQLTPAQGS